jgi:3-deoxy-D-arabino-heptulosonate 7-phosphate (DAHP) synthase class II
MLKILAADYLSNNASRMFDLLNDDPEALYAFLMLKAADDMGIDIGVTPEEIVECFKGKKATSKPTPFPFF